MNRALEKRHMKRANLDVTFLGFGALEIGRNWGFGKGEDTLRPDDKGAAQVLNCVLDSGINLIDTASAYHQSERRIGEAVSARRNEYILASKCGEHSDDPRTYYDFSYQAIKNSIDNSLKLLKTDVIDIMQIHFGPDQMKVLDDGETVAAMKDAQKEGKVRYLGASCDGEVAKRCVLSGDFDVMQLGCSLLFAGNDDVIGLCAEHGLGVFIRGGLGMGKLTARAPKLIEQGYIKGEEAEKVQKIIALCGGNLELFTALALRYLYEKPGISSVLVGTKNPARIQENIQLLSMDVSQDLLKQAIAIAQG